MNPAGPRVISRMCSTTVEVWDRPEMPRPFGGGVFVPDQVEVRYLCGEDSRWRAWEWIVSGWIVRRPGERESVRRCASGHAGDDPSSMPSWVGQVIEACRPSGT